MNFKNATLLLGILIMLLCAPFGAAALPKTCPTPGVSHETQLLSDTCPIVQLPYVEKFDSVHRFGCWSRSGLIAPSISTNPVALRFNAGPSSYALAVMPAIDEYAYDITTLEVRFQVRPTNNTTNGFFEVGIMTDPGNIYTFTPIEKAVFSNSVTWQDFTIYLSNYTGNGQHIAFRWRGAADNSIIFLNNVVINEAPNCLPPTGFTVHTPEATNVLLSWDLSGTYQDYEIEYAPADSNEWNVTTAAGSYVILSNLNPQTNYKARIRTECFSTDTNWSPVAYFLTAPDAAQIITIANGTSAGSVYIPFNSGFPRSQTQQIFYASELGNDPLSISSIALQYVNAEDISRKISIYLAHTDTTVFARSTSIVPDSCLTLMYKGTVNFSKSYEDSWNIIPFDSNFSYNGTQNLLLVVKDSVIAALYSKTRFATHTVSNGASLPTGISTYTYYNSGGSPYRGLVNTRTNTRFFSAGESICHKPNALRVTPSTEEATITWVEMGTANQYLISIQHEDSTSWVTVDTTLNGEEYTFTNLIPATQYSIEIRTICGIGDSSEVVSASFTTLCESTIASIPYSENFDTYSNNDFPRCWSYKTSIPGNEPYISYSSNAGDYHSANNVLTFNNTPSAYNTVILPALPTGEDLASMQLTLWGKTTSLNSGKMYIGAMTDPNNIETFQLIDSLIPATTDWDRYIIRLDAYSGTGRYLAMMWKNGISNSFIIDDLELDYTANCIVPHSLVFGSITPSTVLIDWIDENGSQNWDIEYVLSGASQGSGTTVPADHHPYTLANLESNTAYDIYLRSRCEGDNSIWSLPGSIKTPQEPATFPYECDFEDNTEVKEWTMLNRTYSNQWVIGSAVNSGTALYISNSNGVANDYYRGPNSATKVMAFRDISFGTTPSNFLLEFEWKGMGKSNVDFMRVYLGECEQNETAITFPPANAVLLADNLSEQVNWQQEQIMLSDTLSNKTKRLYFYWENASNSQGNSPAGAIDNVKVNTLDCVPPRNITATPINHSSVQINWDKGGYESNWNIDYGIAGFTPVLGTYHATDTFFTITGLAPSTSYDFHIESNCMPSTSNAVSISFETPCEQIEFPYTMSFDQDIEDDYPACWGRFSGVSFATYPRIGARSFSSPNSLYFFSNSNKPTIAVTQQLGDHIVLDSLYIEFKMYKVNANSKIDIGIMTDPSDTTTFTLLESFSPGTERNWETTFILSRNYTGNGKHIAFRSVGNNEFYIDDVFVSHIPECIRPTNIEITDTTTNAATISWQANNNENEWLLGYKIASDSYWTTVPVSNTPSYRLGSLENDTAYDIRVQSLCSASDSSIYAFSFFKTKTENQTCAEPFNLEVSQITDTTAKITWNAGYLENKWYLDYAQTGGTIINGDTCHIREYTLRDLSPGTEYRIRLKAICDENNESSNAEILFSTTSPNDTTTFLIRASFSGNGTITPSGDIRVKKGVDTTFTITPNEGHAIHMVSVDGADVGAVTSYTFYNVTEDHTIEASFAVGINQYSDDSKFVVYPNPAKNNLRIEYTGSYEQLIISNLPGQTVMVLPLAGNSADINVSNLKPGIYFITLYGNNKRVSKKFIKE